MQKFRSFLLIFLILLPNMNLAIRTISNNKTKKQKALVVACLATTKFYGLHPSTSLRLKKEKQQFFESKQKELLDENINCEQANQLAKIAAEKYYKKLWRKTDEVKTRKTTPEYKKQQRAWKQQFNDRKKSKQNQVNTTTNIEKPFISSINKEIKNKQEQTVSCSGSHIGQPLQTKSTRKKNPFPINFKTCFESDFSDATSLEFILEDKNLHIDDFENAQNIPVHDLQHLLPELSAHKKRKQSKKS